MVEVKLGFVGDGNGNGESFRREKGESGKKEPVFDHALEVESKGDDLMIAGEAKENELSEIELGKRLKKINKDLDSLTMSFTDEELLDEKLVQVGKKEIAESRLMEIYNKKAMLLGRYDGDRERTPELLTEFENCKEDLENLLKDVKTWKTGEDEGEKKQESERFLRCVELIDATKKARIEKKNNGEKVPTIDFEKINTKGVFGEELETLKKHIADANAEIEKAGNTLERCVDFVERTKRARIEKKKKGEKVEDISIKYVKIDNLSRLEIEELAKRIKEANSEIEKTKKEEREEEREEKIRKIKERFARAIKKIKDVSREDYASLYESAGKAGELKFDGDFRKEIGRHLDMYVQHQGDKSKSLGENWPEKWKQVNFIVKALNDSQTEYTYIVVDGKTFLVEVLEDEAVETVKKDAEKNEKSGIINIEDPSNIVAEKKGTPVESKEKAFEINVSKKEKLEEDLIRAFHSIEAIEGDELDIDFAPAEKHFSGNLRDKIGELLNKSNLIDENPVGKEAEKYWDELNALQKLGEEVIGLEKKNQVCVTYENNTFFINKKRETAGQDLEKVVADVISEKYLKAFIFGIQGDYEKYVATLKENPKWFGLNDGKKRELLESGIVFYVDEILNENEKSPSSDVREKIYKYAFTRLNK